MDFDVEPYLASKGYKAKRTSGAELIYPCFFSCEDASTDKSHWKLYINAESGLYDCKRCMERGNIKTLYRHFGDEWIEESTPATPRRTAVLEGAVALGEQYLKNNDDVLLYLLKERGLSAESILDRRLGVVTPPWSLVRSLEHFTRDDLNAAAIVKGSGDDHFTNHILIPYIENNRIVQVRGKDLSTGRYATGPGDVVRLFNVDSARGAEDVILVEGEFDAMVLEQLLKSSGDPRLEATGVIGLPGANAVPEDIDYRLESAKRIFIGTDPDETGRKAAEKLKERLGGRARILAWPDSLIQRAFDDGLQLKQIDWTTWIAKYGATAVEVSGMLREAAGSRLQTVSQAANAFRSRPTSGGLTLGFYSLDALLKPGLLPGQVMVALAKTGAGKTVWLCNVAHNLISRRVLFITLEMTSSEIYERLARIYRFYRPYATDAEVETAFSTLLICDENKLTEKDFELLVEDYTSIVGEAPELVIVDYLGYYARGVKGNTPYEKTSNAVMQLKAEAKKHRVAIIAPHQVNRVAKEGRPIDMDDARDSGVVAETADFLLSIYRPDDGMDLNSPSAEPSGRLRVGVLKSRHGNKDRVVSLQMGLLSLVIVDDTSIHANLAKAECQEAFRGVSYEQYLASRRAPKQSQLGGS